MEKKKGLTLQKLLFIYWGILLGTVLILMMVYGALLYRNSRENILKNAGVIAAHDGFRLDRDISAMQEAVDSIYVNNRYYRQVRTGGLDDYDWIGASNYLTRSLQEQTDSFGYAGGMFFYDAQRDSMRSIYSDYPFAGVKTGLDARLKETLRGEQTGYRDYTFLEYEQESWLIYFLKTGDTYLGFTLNLNRYFGEEKVTVAYVYQKERIVAETGGERIPDEDMWKALASGTSVIGKGGEILTPQRLSSMEMTLVVSMGDMSLSGIWRRPDFWLFIFLIPVISFALLFLLLRNLRSIILYPIEHIVYRIGEMTPGREGSEEVLLPGKKKTLRIEEFEQINRRIDEVLEEMVRLQEERFQEKQRANDVQLQYYQLQVNPHFFLNCLNSISSLLETHSVDAAGDMIRAFSSYFRYVFRSQKKPVTVEEELKVVRDYCNIYSLKGGFPILLETDAKEETRDCRIPILCIQTFVENSVKHAAKNGMILKVRVQVGMLTDEEGGERLSICITDNGCGYPEEMLEELNRPVVEFLFNSWHVGIENLKYRLYLTFQEQAKWYFYNSPYGGAITEITLPVRRQEED